VYPTTAEGLAKLHPVEPDGVITYGTQTHPADGTAGVVVTSGPVKGTGPVARLRSAAFARVEKSRIPEAPVPAARAALEHAGIGIESVHVVTTHSPFALNDVYFSQQMGVAIDAMNPSSTATRRLPPACERSPSSCGRSSAAAVASGCLPAVRPATRPARSWSRSTARSASAPPALGRRPDQ